VLAATQLRRLFAENDDVPDPLVHELSACIDVAERRGLAVSLAVSGETVLVTSGSLGVEVAWYAHGEQMRMEASWRPEPTRPD
jgi:hypothetical protein